MYQCKQNKTYETILENNVPKYHYTEEFYTLRLMN